MRFTSIDATQAGTVTGTGSVRKRKVGTSQYQWDAGEALWGMPLRNDRPLSYVGTSGWRRPREIWPHGPHHHDGDSWSHGQMKKT